jgi:Domain of unknown function (DUF1839)
MNAESAPVARWCARAGVLAAMSNPSPLHASERMWVEKNCYVDIWISVIHSLGLDPRACLPFVLAVDFEGDQWTFFKPNHDDLYELYGVDVQELTVWQPLLEHAREHLAAGRLISTESDAYWLPDTAGTDYRSKHTKTTIVLNEVDLGNRRLGYFHNTGYHWLEGEDFDRTFQIIEVLDPKFMPMYAELMKCDRMVARPQPELRAMSAALLRKYLKRIPASNPIAKFHARFGSELPTLQARGLEHYHAWAFAVTRQLGAAMELAAQHLRWLNAEGSADLEVAAAAFEQISALNKSFILKGARLVASKKATYDEAMFVQCAESWDRGMAALAAHVRG